MKLISITEKDRETFNSFMASHPKGHILQSFEWGEVKETTGWQPLRFLVVENDDIKAGITILKRKIPFRGKSIFYAPRGPVADYEDHKTLDFLFREIKNVARKHGAIFLKLDPDIPAYRKDVTDYLKKRGFISADKGLNFEGVQPKFVFRLPLDKDEDEMLKSFHSKTRYNIRLAYRRGVKIRKNCAKQDLKVFYDILQETSERDKFLIRSYDYFETLWDKLVENNLARLFMAEYEGRPIAGSLAFIFGDKAWYIYGASSNKHRNVMPNYALQWEMIKWAKAQGCTMYDFRGVSGDLSPDNPLYGLYRFKKGFNGEFTEFIGEYDLPFDRVLYFLWERVIPFYRKTRRQMVNLKRKFF
ncbi:MAG: hypothetical protein PWQ82_1276 [Thermosediminibacterales bacterium]|nr:hypothetical protein [Thermosediminibacterales bacterium]